MKFQTKEEVKQAAEESDESALLCSIEHYNQMLAASEKELREARYAKITGPGSGFCSLCNRYLYVTKRKGRCPMRADCRSNCFDEWHRLPKAEDDATWPEVRAAMGEVRRVLQEKYDELYSCKKEEKKKPEFEPKEFCHIGVGVVQNRIVLRWCGTIKCSCVNTAKEAQRIVKFIQSAIDFVEANK